MRGVIKASLGLNPSPKVKLSNEEVLFNELFLEMVGKIYLIN